MINLQPAATWQLIAGEQECHKTGPICIHGCRSRLIQLYQIWLGARHLSKQYMLRIVRPDLADKLVVCLAFSTSNPPKATAIDEMSSKFFVQYGIFSDFLAGRSTSSAKTLTPCIASILTWGWCVDDDRRLGIEKSHILLIRKGWKADKRIIVISTQISWQSRKISKCAGLGDWTRLVWNLDLEYFQIINQIYSLFSLVYTKNAANPEHVYFLREILANW